MPLIHNKTHTLPSGLHYAYTYQPPASSSHSKPTLLFLHGFPSTAHDWRHQITHFTTQGYGILVPDLLGYGGTSKPLSVEPYIGKLMSADIIAIMHHEGIKGEVIGIAHDWGTYLLSQLAMRYYDRFTRFVFMSVPFSPPGREMDVAQINRTTKERLGYEQFGYWLFLTKEGAGRIMGKHWESFFHLAFAADSEIWRTSFVPVGRLEEFITNDQTCALAPFITADDKAHHHSAFGDDYSACVNWYHRGIANLGAAEEMEQVNRGEIRATLGKETLMIAGTKDPTSSAERAQVSMAGSVEKGKLKVVEVDAGHWIMLEKAEETNRLLEEFFEKGVDGITKSVL